jgi:hypothetical protein
MTPDQLDAVSDSDYAAMVRLMYAEAAAIERANRKLARH